MAQRTKAIRSNSFYMTVFLGNMVGHDGFEPSSDRLR
jgi:hypothetical protein